MSTWAIGGLMLLTGLVGWVVGCVMAGKQADGEKAMWRKNALDNADVARAALRRCWDWQKWHAGRPPRIAGDGKDDPKDGLSSRQC